MVHAEGQEEGEGQDRVERDPRHEKGKSIVGQQADLRGDHIRGVNHVKGVNQARGVNHIREVNWCLSPATPRGLCANVHLLLLEQTYITGRLCVCVQENVH